MPSDRERRSLAVEKLRLLNKSSIADERGKAELELISDVLKGMKLPVKRKKEPVSVQLQLPGASADKQPTPIQQRILAAAAEQELTGAMYLHSVLAQTSLPYRDPGVGVREWDRRNGKAWLLLSAGKVIDPHTDQPVHVGLPYGPKARLILAHLSTEALLSGRPEIETEDTLTRFVSKSLGMDSKGRNIRNVKEQLVRLAACTIRLGMVEAGRSVHVSSQIVSSFDLWSKSEGEQRILWPKVIRLSKGYFDSLMRHAVPLNESHLIALSHSAMALDIYTWLAQRLHRISQFEPALVPWVSLFEQFGSGYDRIRKFRQVFLVSLTQVLLVYRTAHVKVSGGGLHLYFSQTPVPPKAISGSWN